MHRAVLITLLALPLSRGYRLPVLPAVPRAHGLKSLPSAASAAVPAAPALLADGRAGAPALSRRSALVGAAAAATAAAWPRAASALEGSGWSVDVPDGWVLSNKPLKTHAEEQRATSPTSGKFYAGITVDPIRVESLAAFGTPEFVAQRIVEVELKRDGVTEATLVSSAEAQRGGRAMYCIDYTSVSSRGTNRYATTVFIGGGKLYTLTVQAPADAWAGVASVAGGIAESFRVVA